MNPDFEHIKRMVDCLNKSIPCLNMKIIEPREDDNDFSETMYVVFFADDDGSHEKEYKDGYAANHSYILKNAKDEWFFTYRVDNPGVMYYKDGSGEPPSVDFVDVAPNQNGFFFCLKELILFKITQDMCDAMQFYDEQELDRLLED